LARDKKERFTVRGQFRGGAVLGELKRGAAEKAERAEREEHVRAMK